MSVGLAAFRVWFGRFVPASVNSFGSSAGAAFASSRVSSRSASLTRCAPCGGRTEAARNGAVSGVSGVAGFMGFSGFMGFAGIAGLPPVAPAVGGMVETGGAVSGLASGVGAVVGRVAGSGVDAGVEPAVQAGAVLAAVPPVDVGAGSLADRVLERLVALVVETPPAGTEGMSLVFDRPIPSWVWLFVVVAAVAVAVWSYRRLALSRTGWTRGVRVAVVVARTIAILLLVFLVLGPSVRFERTRVERDRLVVLVDRSRSLGIADAGGGRSRDEELAGTLASGETTLLEIARSKDLEFIGFAGGVFALPRADGASVLPALGEATGDRTDLDGALRQALERAAGRPVSAVLVLSDGRSAVPVSSEVFRAFEREGVPVFAMPLGADRPVGDAAIVAASAPAAAFLRDRVPVEVRVERGGFAGALEVRLVDAADGSEIARRAVSATPDADGGETIYLDGVGEIAGQRAWRVELVGDAPDLVRENDAREVVVEFVDRPIRVLYVEGSSRWEYRYLKNLLVREENVESSVMLLSADRDFAQEGNMPIARLPRTAEEFARYDLFVIGDVPSGFFSPDQLAVMRAQVGERGAGLLWIGGERSMPSSWESTPLADLLPFRPPLALEPRAGASLVRPTPAAERLGVLRLSDDEDGWPDAFEDRSLSWPRLRWVQSIARGRLKPTAEVLAEAEGVGLGAEEPSAAVVRMRFGAGEVVYVATDEIWRWRYGQGERYPERFWIPMLRLLAREAVAHDGRRATLAVRPARTTPGSTVMVELEIGDDEAVAATPGVVSAEVFDESGAVVAKVDLARDGAEAVGALPVDRAGRFRVVARDPAFGEAEAAFDSVRSDDELRRGDTDHAALAAVATRTGGRILGGDEWERLRAALPERARASDESVVETVWDRPAAFVCVLLLLGFEWIGRRVLRLV